MKKIKLSESEIKLLCLLFALIVIAGSYFFVFTPKMDEAAVIEEQNITDQGTVNQLENMVARKAEVEKETAEYEQQIKDIIAKYPSNITTEKSIEIVRQLEKNTKVHMKDINFEMNNFVGIIGEQPVAEETSGETQEAAEGQTDTDGTQTQETADSDVVISELSDNTGSNVGYYAQLTMNYEAAYEDFKKMIHYIGELEDRATVPIVSSAFDSESGKLTGSITVKMFYLTNTDKEYVEPDPGNIRSGVKNIFKTKR